MNKTFLVILVLAGFASRVAVAQNGDQPVWSYDYAPKNAQATKNRHLTTAQDKNAPPGPPPFQKAQRQGQFLRGNNADAAWARQWGPIQELTGVSSGTAKQFIQDVKVRFIEDNKKVLSSAQDWATIAGASGLVGATTDSTTDWFKYITIDIPTAFTSGGGSSAPVSTGFIGGNGGFGSFPSASAE